MIEFYIQFEGEKNESNTNVFNLNEGNYKGIKADLVNWKITLRDQVTVTDI